MKSLTLSALFIILLSQITVNSFSQSKVHLFAYFKGNGDGLHLAYSRNGYNWQALKNDSIFLKPTAGKDKLLRDPCIIRAADGSFHMVWTVSWNEKGLGYANSKDLKNWSEQKYVPVMEHEANARNTWAPEITYDEKKKEYMIYWATTIIGLYPETQVKGESAYNHRIYYVTTKDFKNFSKTRLLYEPGFNVIDATIGKDKDQYIMFLKDETLEPVQKNIKIATSKNLTGPYTKAGAPITGNYWAEGPTTLKLGKNWLVYFDKYRDHKMGAIQSHDLKNWKDISDEISFPAGMRHGTIFTITQEEFDELLKD